jgi:hypothetical protein
MLSTFLKMLKVSKKFIIVESQTENELQMVDMITKEQCGFKYIELKS